ncbi:MAG: F0F1 ATP synthase subunit B [Candidatus Doudnabacteria bacterium]
MEHTAASGSVTALLGLDWKLFLAQLFNFVIVLFVLWKWVFKPLGAKLEERSNQIELSIKHSEEVEEKLKDAEKYRQAEMEKVRTDANVAIQQAQKNAEGVRDQILAEAKLNSEKILQQAKKEIQNEKDKAMSHIREEGASLVVMATEKILREKLDLKKDGELIKVSLKNI